MQSNAPTTLKRTRFAAGLMAAVVMTALLTFSMTAAAAQPKLTKEEKIMDARRAAPSSISMKATIKDWDDSVLYQGSNGWVCRPTKEAHVIAGKAREPVCNDAVWQKYMASRKNNKPFKTDRIGFSYMLMGDNGTSNLGPGAEGPTPDNEWVTTGPHLMILVPDENMLEGIPADPESGGPYIMHRETPGVHIMVPTQ
jgi:hypothetical protein